MLKFTLRLRFLKFGGISFACKRLSSVFTYTIPRLGRKQEWHIITDGKKGNGRQ